MAPKPQEGRLCDVLSVVGIGAGAASDCDAYPAPALPVLIEAGPVRGTSRVCVAWRRALKRS